MESIRKAGEVPAIKGIDRRLATGTSETAGSSELTSAAGMGTKCHDIDRVAVEAVRKQVGLSSAPACAAGTRKRKPAVVVVAVPTRGRP